MNILFTGVGRRIELLQAFRNAALVLNKNLKIYGADMAGTAPALAYCDYTRKAAPMKDSGYIDNLLQICADDHIDLLIPTIDTDLLVLSENKEKFEVITRANFLWIAAFMPRCLLIIGGNIRAGIRRSLSRRMAAVLSMHLRWRMKRN